MENLPFKEGTFQIIGFCMGVRKTLGYGFSESVYKDTMELEFMDASVPFFRERELTVSYKSQILPHHFLAEFLSFNKIIVEVKSSDSGIIDDHIAQTLNYLRVSDNSIGLIINFGKRRLEYKGHIL